MLGRILTVIVGTSLTVGAAAQPQSQSVSDAEVEAFQNFSTPKANNDWDVSKIRDTCWAIITYQNILHAKEAHREVSLTHDFAKMSGELRAYTKGERNPHLRELSTGVGDFAIYFGRPLVGTWVDNVRLEVDANHGQDIYSFRTPVEIGGFLNRFEQLPGFSIYTGDKRKKLFDGYSEGNVTGVPKMKECLKAGGWTPRSGAK
ncbi:hypothetical protein [Sphingopyxis sp.]|uniref:hypothetical protein n=1 Tax=Sphingopyxis sp. TaxID=1908224 RepID=UPI002E06F1FF|nr:hypothetical protein [Sphingopyxis sp.]